MVIFHITLSAFLLLHCCLVLICRRLNIIESIVNFVCELVIIFPQFVGY